jgi:hypothetical protein
LAVLRERSHDETERLAPTVDLAPDRLVDQGHATVRMGVCASDRGLYIHSQHDLDRHVRHRLPNVTSKTL